MKILVLVSRFPWPLEKGDKLRAFQHIKALSSRHEVHLFALNLGSFDPSYLDQLKPFCKSIRIIKLTNLNILFNLMRGFIAGLPLQISYFYSDKVKEKVNAKISELKPDLIYCQLIRMAEYVKDNDSYPKVIDYQDAFSKGVQQRANRSLFFIKPFLNMEFKRLKNYESSVFLKFNDRLIISEQDREAMDHPRKDLFHIIPNGIDTALFKPDHSSKKYDVIFTGNMNYFPNVDSATFLVKEIIPLVKREFPEIKILIAGANPTARVKGLRNKNVEVSGWVEKMSDCYATSKVFCAPMRIGTGLQNKLLEAMAMKVPCITTSLCNNALKAKNNESILVADDAKTFSDSIIDLLKNPEKANRISEGGLSFAKEHYDMNTINLRLEHLLTEVAKNGKA